MPIYDYTCENCQNQFEELVLPNDTEPTLQCPECHSSSVKRLMSPGSFRPHGIPKGSGGFKPPKCKMGKDPS